MLRLSAFFAMPLCAASLVAAQQPFTIRFGEGVANARPENAAGDRIERVVPSDDGELADADDDMPEDEDLEYMCYDCPPPWSITASWLYLTRERLNDGAILTNTVGGATLLDAAAFDFDHQPGFDIAASYSCDGCTGYELRGMWLDDWNASALTESPGSVDIATAPVTGPLTNAMFETTYLSRFRSIEANTRRNFGAADLLVGFRYAALDERMLVRGTGIAPDTETRFTTQNDLFGLQLGLAGDWQAECSGWGVAGFAKVGAYYDSASGDASFVANAVQQGAVSADDDSLAFLGEAGIDLTYAPRANMVLHAGYRLLVLDGVAIAAEQIDRTSSLGVINPTLATHTSGTFFAHGFSAGVEVAW